MSDGAGTAGQAPVNPYVMLGLPHAASPEEIRAAYRLLVKQVHADGAAVPHDAEDRLKQINAAYQFLKDPERRAAFDLRWRTRAAVVRNRRRIRLLSALVMLVTPTAGLLLYSWLQPSARQSPPAVATLADRPAPPVAVVVATPPPRAGIIAEVPSPDLATSTEAVTPIKPAALAALDASPLVDVVAVRAVVAAAVAARAPAPAGGDRVAAAHPRSKPARRHLPLSQADAARAARAAVATAPAKRVVAGHVARQRAKPVATPQTAIWQRDEYVEFAGRPGRWTNDGEWLIAPSLRAQMVVATRRRRERLMMPGRGASMRDREQFVDASVEASNTDYHIALTPSTFALDRARTAAPTGPKAQPTATPR